jgi:hypothetical protein
VDHQIEHHRYIVGTVGVGAVSSRLEYHDFFTRHHLEQFAEGRVEALDVADLKQSPRRLRRLDQGGGFLLGGCDRLLDQHMGTGFQSRHANAVVEQGGHCDADRLHLRQQVVIVGEPATAELLDGQAPPLLIGIGHADQLGITQQAEHAGVVPAHVADADHPDAHRVHGSRNAQPVDYR